LANRSDVLWWQDSSIYDAAESMGISLELVTDAALGNADALAEVTRQAKAWRDAQTGSRQDLEGYDNTLDKLLGGIERVNGEYENGVKISEQKTEADGKVVDSTGEVTDAISEQEEASKELIDALQGVIDAYEGLAHGSMGVAEAHDKALDSINKMKDAADEEKASITGVNDESIKFRDSLRDVEQAHYDSATSIIENGGTLADARKEWQSGREEVVTMRHAKGMDIEKAREWADKNLGSAKAVERALA